MNQRLVRFDVRLCKDDYLREAWIDKRRDEYLLRPDIEWPLSVDEMVWPSVFFFMHRDEALFPHAYIEVDPEVTESGDWLDLEKMKLHYESHRGSNPRGVLIAIHLFSKKSLADDLIPYEIQGGIECAMELGRTNPGQCPPGSVFLGYDVADAGGISGLVNCGYTPEERGPLAGAWGPKLNSFGLLQTLEEAMEFRGVTDLRVAEHAPFWIFGISRLASHSAP